MSHILFITRYYWPEKCAASTCIGETARRLAAWGYQVTVLTTIPSYPTGIVPCEYRGRLLQEEMHEGVRIVRAWSYASANSGFFKRIFSQLSFGCLAPLLGGKAIGQPDIIVLESPPLFNVIAGLFLSWRKQCPFLFWVADLWPESAIHLGVLNNPLAIKLSTWLAQLAYKHANGVIAVTQEMQDILLGYGLPRERVVMIPNGVDTQKFRPQSRDEARTRLGWDERFTVLYAGTHGLAHGLTTVLNAAELLQQQQQIRFVFVGDGAEKTMLIARARERQLTNVDFFDPLPHEFVPELLSAADICLAHTRKLQIFEGMLPIKMYEAMSCGKPLILALNGEACKLAVEDARAAVHVEPENEQQLADAVLYLYEHPEVARQLGREGRAYIEVHFDYDDLTALFEAQIQATLQERFPLRATGFDITAVVESSIVKSFKRICDRITTS